MWLRKKNMASMRRLAGDEATTPSPGPPPPTRVSIKSTLLNGGLNCPSCNMPFDKGKKRRLIDNCGHERCYTCMFHNETCPLCCPGLDNGDDYDDNSEGLIEEFPLEPHFKGSQITLYGEIAPQYFKTERSRVKTNGHFTTTPQFHCEETGHPGKLPKTRPTRTRNAADVMVQSCPTPPQSRRKFFPQLKPQRNCNNSIESTMSASTEFRNWRSLILGKIKSLWTTETSSANAGLNQLLADDGSMDMNNPQPLPPTMVQSKKNSEDMYMRLGLLLGDSAQKKTHHSSIYEVISSNTSPLSTLTISSEDHRKNPYSESTSSIMSMSGHSNCSNSSPIVGRRNIPPSPIIHPQIEENHRSCRKTSRKNTKSPDSVYKPPQLTLKPLFFEVPLQEPDPLFIGRNWIIKEIEDVLASPSQGILLSGNPGTGKTSLILQLVQFSCFGRNAPLNEPVRNMDPVRVLSRKIIAYHFCQADNNNTCLVPDFIHSLASQLCQAPQLTAYRDHLLSEQHLQSALSLKECIANPDVALVRGILEPLTNLEKTGRIKINQAGLILIDALCEAEYHRPDHGETITSFLAKHACNFPGWIKILVTIRTQLVELAKSLTYTQISLNSCNENASKDMLNYINFRLKYSPSITSNIIGANGENSDAFTLHKFAQHLHNLSECSFLYSKLTLDLLERGHLVAKSSGFKVLPVNLPQIYLLHFNLRFPTKRSFDRVSAILSVCLGALYPLTLLEIYYSVNALNFQVFTGWTEFLACFKLLSGFLIKRLDNTYMFFHPSFREWLIHGGDDVKFKCELREGHAGIALRLSRIQAPLDPEKTLELSHHLLKAHVYKNSGDLYPHSRDLQAFWVAECSKSTSDAISNIRNMYSPNVKVSRLLLLAGASPNAITNFLGNAPILCMYAHEGITQMVQLLLEFSADVELTNSQGATALSLASSKGHCDIIKILLNSDARPGHPDTAGICPLVHASRNGNSSIVSLFSPWEIETEDDVAFPEAAQQSLIAASGLDHLEIVEYFLNFQCVDINLADSLTGETALTIAAMNGCTKMCKFLLENGANLNISNKRGLNALHLSVKEGHWSFVEVLLEKSTALVEQVDKNGKTPLMYAACEGYVGLIELLLDKGGANIHKEDVEGLTALCWGLLRGRQLAVQTLLERGAKINRTDKMGRTPLDLAAYQGNPTTVQILLERGAIIEHVDLNGMRPLDRAIGCRNIQVVQCFLKKGAKLGPATWAMAAGKPDIILILLNKLLEDGNILYRKNRLQEAAHRYQYALKKFPQDESQVFYQLKINFLLNYSRCKRKLNETEEAIELANDVLTLKRDSYEAFYARAKALLKLSDYDRALKDVKEALKLSPLQNMQIRKVLVNLRDEINMKLNNPNSNGKRDFTHSVDVLNE